MKHIESKKWCCYLMLLSAVFFGSMGGSAAELSLYGIGPSVGEGPLSPYPSPPSPEGPIEPF